MTDPRATLEHNVCRAEEERWLRRKNVGNIVGTMENAEGAGGGAGEAQISLVEAVNEENRENEENEGREDGELEVVKETSSIAEKRGKGITIPSDETDEEVIRPRRLGTKYGRASQSAVSSGKRVTGGKVSKKRATGKRSTYMSEDGDSDEEENYRMPKVRRTASMTGSQSQSQKTKSRIRRKATTPMSLRQKKLSGEGPNAVTAVDIEDGNDEGGDRNVRHEDTVQAEDTVELLYEGDENDITITPPGTRKLWSEGPKRGSIGVQQLLSGGSRSITKPNERTTKQAGKGQSAGTGNSTVGGALGTITVPLQNQPQYPPPPSPEQSILKSTAVLGEVDGPTPHTKRLFEGIESNRQQISELSSKLGVLMSTLDTLTAAVEMVRGKNDGKGRTTTGNTPVRGKVIPRQQYVDIMNMRLPKLEIAFNRDMLTGCITAVSFQELTRRIDKDDLTLKSFTEFLEILMFSVQNKETKRAFQSDIGQKACNFRKNLLVNILSHARRNSFSTFRIEEEDHVDETDLGDDDVKPSWLDYCENTSEWYINGKHMEKARERVEKNVDDNGYRRRAAIANGAQANREDDGDYVCSTIYSRMKNCLKGSRRNFGAEFCELLGYIFESWDDVRECGVSSNSVTVFKAEKNVPDYEEDFDNARDTFPALKCQGKKLSPCDTQSNQDAFNQFSTGCDDMMYMITHDVMVKRAGSSGTEKVSLTRLVNLMDVSLHFLSACCSGLSKNRNAYDILRLNKRSVEVIFRVSKVFKVVMDTSIGSDGRMKKSKDGDVRRLLDFLRPCETLLRRSVYRSTMNMSLARFRELSCTKENVDEADDVVSEEEARNEFSDNDDDEVEDIGNGRTTGNTVDEDDDGGEGVSEEQEDDGDIVDVM